MSGYCSKEQNATQSAVVLTWAALGPLSRIPRLYSTLKLIVAINDEGSSSCSSSVITYPFCPLGASPGKESASLSRPQLNWPISWLGKHKLLSLFYILDWTVSIQQCDIKQSWNAASSSMLKKRIASQRVASAPDETDSGEASLLGPRWCCYWRGISMDLFSPRYHSQSLVRSDGKQQVLPGWVDIAMVGGHFCGVNVPPKSLPVIDNP